MSSLSSIACGCRLAVPANQKVECGEWTGHITRILVVSYRENAGHLFAMATDASGPDDGPLFEIEIVDEYVKRDILSLPIRSMPSLPPPKPKPSTEKTHEYQTPFQSLQNRHKRYKKANK